LSGRLAECAAHLRAMRSFLPFWTRETPKTCAELLMQLNIRAELNPAVYKLS
jgi:hypothetical protein